MIYEDEVVSTGRKGGTLVAPESFQIYFLVSGTLTLHNALMSTEKVYFYTQCNSINFHLHDGLVLVKPPLHT